MVQHHQLATYLHSPDGVPKLTQLLSRYLTGLKPDVLIGVPAIPGLPRDDGRAKLPVGDLTAGHSIL